MEMQRLSNMKCMIMRGNYLSHLNGAKILKKNFCCRIRIIFSKFATKVSYTWNITHKIWEMLKLLT
jgi:hypothetical protein